MYQILDVINLSLSPYSDYYLFVDVEWLVVESKYSEVGLSFGPLHILYLIEFTSFQLYISLPANTLTFLPLFLKPPQKM